MLSNKQAHRILLDSLAKTMTIRKVVTQIIKTRQNNAIIESDFLIAIKVILQEIEILYKSVLKFRIFVFWLLLFPT